MARTRLWLGYGAAWAPFAVYWVALFLLDRGSPGDALASSVAMALAAAALGLGVYWVSGRYPWSERGRLAFVAVHLGLGLLFGGLLALLDGGLAAAHHGSALVAFLGARLGHTLRDIVVYSWLYGLVAGVCYAVRAQRRFREERLAAARAEALAARARLAALRAQLRPHFLFNALHTVSVLVRRDPGAAEEALARLGDLLRRSLDGADDEEPELAEEWRFTRDYLALESLRLGARLRVEARIAPEALSCRVPAFTLQPLVENALVHGIARRPEGGRLQVEAVVLGGELVLRVGDDGHGALGADLDSDRGLGLRALRERLAARHGSRGSLAIATAPGRGFRATVRLPATREEPAEAASA